MNCWQVQSKIHIRVKRKKLTRKSDTSLGLGEKVVLERLPPLPKAGAYHIFCNNFFSSLRLFVIAMIKMSKYWYYQKQPIRKKFNNESKIARKKPQGFVITAPIASTA